MKLWKRKKKLGKREVDKEEKQRRWDENMKEEETGRGVD